MKPSVVDADSLDEIYMTLLGRPVDDVAKGAWVGRMSCGGVLKEVLSSSEFKANLARILSYGRDHTRAIRDTDAFYRFIAGAIPDFDALMRCHTEGGSYFEFHRRRFIELHSFLSQLNERRPIRRILDISTMPFTTSIFARYLRPSLRVATIDLPPEMGGPEESRLAGWGVAQYVSSDLNVADFDALRRKLTASGLYDVVVASEVTEHLQRDFAEVAGFCLSCLAPNGVVFVSTPNYLSPWRLQTIANGDSPQQRFTDFHSNRGGHYHYREYTMQEMVSDICDAGGHVLAQVYSDCYENHPLASYDLRDCLVVIFGKDATPIF